MMIKALVFVITLGTSFLFGCTGPIAIDDQQGQSGQGKDRWVLNNCVLEDGTIYPCSIEVDLGRDKKKVSMSLSTPTGYTFDYSASDLRGATQAEIRAAVEKAAIEQQGSIVPGAVDAIVDAVLGL